MSFVAALIFSVAAIALIVIGGVGVGYLPKYVRERVKQEMVIDGPRAQLYSTWQNKTKNVGLYESYYVFHCVNPDAVLNGGASPIVEERGPYVYRSYMYKDVSNISWKVDGTVEYTYHQTYEFDPALSNGTESDVVTTLNLGLIVPLYRSRDNIDQQLALKFLAAGAGVNMFIQLTVGQLLWGYNNSFLEELQKADPKANVTTWVALQTNDDPSMFSGLSAQWSGGEPARGFPDPLPHSACEMTMWSGMKAMPYWGSAYANAINGTDGSQFWPGITAADAPYVFVDSLTRSTKLVSRGTADLDGIELVRFTLDPHQMLNSSANPDNLAFYMNYTGFISRPPAFNLPIVLSKPHYLDADQTYVHVQFVDAIPGGVEVYDTFIDAESITGAVMRVHKRIQLNVLILSIYGGLDTIQTWFPLIWSDEYAEANSQLISDYKENIATPLAVGKYGGASAIALGVVCAILAVVFGRRHHSRKRHINYSSLETDRLNSLPGTPQLR